MIIDKLESFIDGGTKVTFFNWYQWGPQFQDKWDLNKAFLLKI